MIFLDTHIIVWLYSGDLDKISDKAKILIDSEELFISPILMLELQYLLEIDRIKVSALEIYEDLHFRIGLKIDETSWNHVIKTSLDLQHTRDPFDRLIVAHAMALQKILITKDAHILKYYDKAIW